MTPSRFGTTVDEHKSRLWLGYGKCQSKRSVLIVEDEPLIALELRAALHDAGASILAAITIKEALELIRYAKICAAIVDVDLGGHDCSSVCTALTKRSIAFMFYPGYIRTRLRCRLGRTRLPSANQRMEVRWSTPSCSSFPRKSDSEILPTGTPLAIGPVRRRSFTRAEPAM